jgi:hypothetical protein
MQQSPDYTTYVGNRGRAFAVTVLAAAGDRVSVPEGTAVAFSLWDWAGTAKVDNAAATNDQTDADADTHGDLSYAWGATDLDTPGVYHAAFTIGEGTDAWTFPTDRPLVVVVQPNPAGVS